MKNINRILVLSLILILTMAISVGCGESKKAPEGVSQDFYDDMIDVLKQIEKINSDVDWEGSGIDKIDEYKEVKNLLTPKEETILDNIDSLWLWVSIYKGGDQSKLEDSLRVTRYVEDVEALLDIDINLKKILKK